MRVYVELVKTRQFQKKSDVGIHLLKPSADQLADAVLVADDKGFQTVFVYDSSRTLIDLADMVKTGLGLMVGWSNFCQTSDAFVIDERCLNILDEVIV